MDNPEIILSGDRNLKFDGSPEFDYRAVTRSTPPWKIAPPVQGQFNPDGFRFDKLIHREHGNIGFADGSVQQESNTRLRESIHYSLTATTNGLQLLMPVANENER
jgi:prepilin-type processing-associated H-X9-DG protein